MCLACGFYNGRQVIDLEAKNKARQERLEAKRDTIKAQAEEATRTEAEEASQSTPDTSNTSKENKTT